MTMLQTDRWQQDESDKRQTAREKDKDRGRQTNVMMDIKKEHLSVKYLPCVHHHVCCCPQRLVLFPPTMNIKSENGGKNPKEFSDVLRNSTEMDKQAGCSV